MARLDDILTTLRAHQDELRRRGVVRAGLFGSVARGEDTAESDVDVAVEFDREHPIGIFQYNDLGDYLEMLLGRPVDMADPTSARPHFRAEIEKDYKLAF